MPMIALGYNINVSLMDFGDDPKCFVGWSNIVKWQFFLPLLAGAGVCIYCQTQLCRLFSCLDEFCCDSDCDLQPGHSGYKKIQHYSGAKFHLFRSDSNKCVLLPNMGIWASGLHPVPRHCYPRLVPSVPGLLVEPIYINFVVVFRS